MKILFAGVLLFLSCLVHAQDTIYPSASIVNNKYVHDDVGKFQLFMIYGTTKMSPSTLQMSASVEKDRIICIRQTQLGNFEWLDTVIISTKDFSPIYYHSQQPNEETRLNFSGTIIKGTWNNFSEAKVMTDTVKSSFFDFHALPFLVCWLPLKEGKTYYMPVYKFRQRSGGLSSVSITKVEMTKKDDREVMKVTVRENRKDDYISVFYIEMKTHTLIQVDIDNDGKKSLMMRQPNPSL